MHPLQSLAQAFWRKIPVEQRDRPPFDGARNADILMVNSRIMPILLAAYKHPGGRVPGSWASVASVVRNQLTGWLLDFRCETWVGLDLARVNTVCWFVTNVSAAELAEAVMAAHLASPIPAHRQDDWARFLAHTPMRLRPEAVVSQA